jgi:hypothetical protein
MIYALKNINHFSKFTKHFWLNGNNFSIDYYFLPHQTSKNVKIILYRNKQSINYDFEKWEDEKGSWEEINHLSFKTLLTF